jgi:dTDP-4-dehydrorhamnose reductase
LGTALAHLGGWEVNVLDRSRLDLTDLAAIAPTISAYQPEVVINAAAYNRVDEAETRPDLAFLINAAVPGWLARAATSIGARLVHVSTDYVFSGATDRPYREDDVPAPLGVYGASKLAGEHLVRAYAPTAVVVRTSGVFGTPAPTARSQSNFVQAILRQARGAAGREDVALRVVDDQRIGPTYARDLAEAIRCLVARGADGTVHVTNSGSCTWYEFACAIIDEAGLDRQVVPISSAERTDAARRPAYSVLDLGRAGTYSITMPHWRDALHRYLATDAAR